MNRSVNAQQSAAYNVTFIAGIRYAHNILDIEHFFQNKIIVPSIVDIKV